MRHGSNHSNSYHYAAARICAFLNLLLILSAHRDEHYKLRRDLDAELVRSRELLESARGDAKKVLELTKRDAEETEKQLKAIIEARDDEILDLQGQVQELRRQLGSPPGWQPGGAGGT